MQIINQGTDLGISSEAVTSVEVDRSAVNTPIPSQQAPRPTRPPFFIPKQPPPRVLPRYELANPPADGTNVIVTVREGKRTNTYQGRVLFTNAERIRLKEGAGWWDISPRDVVSITAL